MSNVPKGIAANDIPPLQYFFVNNSPCPQGPPGPTGPTGPIGFSGLGQGATGATGATGPNGTVGATGPQGAQGATGVQGNPGAPFLGIGTTGLAGPPGATGLRGPAGGVTIAGDPYGVVVGTTTNNIGFASSGLRYSNSKLSVSGDMFTDTTSWKSPFGVPQTGSASGNNSSSPLPSTPLISLSLNIVNPSTGYSLMDYPAIMVVASMQIRNTLYSFGQAPSNINCTNFYVNGVQVGNMTQYPAATPNLNLYMTRQFFTVLYKSLNQYGPGIASNVQLTCSLQSIGTSETTTASSDATALGTWTANMTAFGLY